MASSQGKAPSRTTVPFDRPLNELGRSRPSEVMSRYSISAKKVGPTQVAFGLRIGFASFAVSVR
jgi:hypothetical protein